MQNGRSGIVVIMLVLCFFLTAAYADVPEAALLGNSYHLYTGAFERSDGGVFAVPSRFKWSVETSWRGVDVQGKDLPDSRVTLRLYDPDQNFTAITAQMDLETAEKLQRNLAEIIAKKRQDPSYQHRPQLYDPKLIPKGRLKIDNEKGTGTLEFEYDQ